MLPLQGKANTYHNNHVISVQMPAALLNLLYLFFFLWHAIRIFFIVFHIIDF